MLTRRTMIGFAALLLCAATPAAAQEVVVTGPPPELRKNLDAEVTRLIDDAKFSRFTREFTSQWLNLDKFSVLEPDHKLFPLLTAFTRTQLRDEPMRVGLSDGETDGSAMCSNPAPPTMSRSIGP